MNEQHALNLLAALQTLHAVCANCELEVQATRPTEHEYRDAMRVAEAAIAVAEAAIVKARGAAS